MAICQEADWSDRTTTEKTPPVKLSKPVANGKPNGSGSRDVIREKADEVIPGEEKEPFIFGGNYGKGLATCRTASGWSAPMFIALGGGRSAARLAPLSPT
jgi:lipid-binding SYLF domain-containing protein